MVAVKRGVRGSVGRGPLRQQPADRLGDVLGAAEEDACVVVGVSH